MKLFGTNTNTAAGQKENPKPAPPQSNTKLTIEHTNRIKKTCTLPLLSNKRVEQSNRLRYYMGNKKNVELDMIRHLKTPKQKIKTPQLTIAELPDVEPSTGSPAQFEGVNFIERNKLKLLALQKRNTVGPSNNIGNSFHLKQFSNVPSRYMHLYNEHVLATKMFKESLQLQAKKAKSSNKISKSKGVSINSSITKRKEQTLDNPDEKGNQISVPSRYRQLLEKYRMKNIEPKFTPKRNEKINNKNNKTKHTTYKLQKIKSIVSKQQKDGTERISKTPTIAQVDTISNQTKHPKKPSNLILKEKVMKSKKQSLKKSNEIKGTKSKYLDFMKAYDRNKKKRKRKLKEMVNARTNDQIEKLKLKQKKKKLKQELRKKYCSNTLAYPRDELERKYEERLARWCQTRHPDILHKPQITHNTPNIIQTLLPRRGMLVTSAKNVNKYATIKHAQSNELHSPNTDNNNTKKTHQNKSEHEDRKKYKVKCVTKNKKGIRKKQRIKKKKILRQNDVASTDNKIEREVTGFQHLINKRSNNVNTEERRREDNITQKEPSASMKVPNKVEIYDVREDSIEYNLL